MKMTSERQKFLEIVKEEHGDIESITRNQIQEICTIHGMAFPHWLTNSDNRLGRGVFGIPNMTAQVLKMPTTVPTKPLKSTVTDNFLQTANSDFQVAGLVPEHNELFVKLD